MYILVVVIPGVTTSWQCCSDPAANWVRGQRRCFDDSLCFDHVIEITLWLCKV